jgi:hypothetical protein
VGGRASACMAGIGWGGQLSVDWQQRFPNERYHTLTRAHIVTHTVTHAHTHTRTYTRARATQNTQHHFQATVCV